MRLLRFLLFSLVGLLSTPLCLAQSKSAPPSGQHSLEREVANLVSQLGADSYLTRSKSARRLAEIATVGDSVSANHVICLLRDNPFPPDDLEVYLAKKRLLDQVQANTKERLLDGFLHDPSFDRTAVAGWDRFRRHAGDSLDARMVYAKAVREDPGIGQRLTTARQLRIHLPDFDGILRRDVATWAIVLCVVCEQGERVSGEDLMRLTATLRGFGTGPDPIRDHERRVISLLVADCLSSVPMDSRDRMVIAVRFRCSKILESDWRQVLAKPKQSPSCIVTALLAASAMNPPPSEVDDFIERFLNDRRVSHVWRSMMPPKTTHRTQVRDVALALKLHRSGVDPRSRGFSALVADPILIFRPYSLGFESDQARRVAHGEP